MEAGDGLPSRLPGAARRRWTARTETCNPQAVSPSTRRVVEAGDEFPRPRLLPPVARWERGQVLSSCPHTWHAGQLPHTYSEGIFFTLFRVHAYAVSPTCCDVMRR
jgi:hypothetical protein